MVFSNAVFLFLFLPIALAVYYSPICRGIRMRNVWLLIVSLGFYGWGEPIYIGLMLLSIIINYILGRIVEVHAKTAKGKWIVGFACLCNLGMLFIFKYVGWIFGDVLGLLKDESVLASLALPIGISFYTFQALSYVIDVYRGRDKAQHNILNLGLYISFFPQLVAGPIVRYGDIASQLAKREHNMTLFSDGVRRFIIGLTKKILMANNIAVLANTAFSSDATELSVGMAWAGALAFLLQIYFDFSGYSDMAIGLGKMFGFEFQENFNYPYMATSVSEYWRRWHMSLGGWFRDYLYYPLILGPGMKFYKRATNKWKWNKKVALLIPNVVTLFVVWMSTGIWHGANMTFVVWGLIQFAALVWERYKKPFKNKKLGLVLGFIATFMVNLITKVIFNANSLSHALKYYAAMFGLNHNSFWDVQSGYWIGQYKVFLILGLIFAFPTIKLLEKRIQSQRGQKIYNVVFSILLMSFLVIDLCFAIAGGYNPFIYFNF